MKNLLFFPLLLCFLSSFSQGIEAFGDSQTEGQGASNEQHKWVYLLGNKTGLGYTNYGAGGTTVYQRGQGDKNFIDKAPNHVNSASYVTIMYGTNSDGNNGTREWIQEYEQIIKENFIDKGYPRDRILLMAPVWNGVYRDEFLALRNVIESIANDLGVRFVDLYTLSRNYVQSHGINSFYNPTDMLHFNDEGHQVVANYIDNIIDAKPLPIQANSYHLTRVKGTSDEFEGSFIASETTDTQEFDIMMGTDGIHYYKVHVIIPQKIIENQTITFKFKLK